MRNWVQLEEFHTFQKVKFFTVRFEDSEESETDKFLAHLDNNAEQIESLNKILSFIRHIGDTFGANKDFFRDESNASVLPPQPWAVQKHDLLYFFEENNSIRLYCMRLSDSVVILFNGGVKTAITAQDCPNVAPKFKQAQRFARAIHQKIVEKEFKIRYKDISSDDELAFEI